MPDLPKGEVDRLVKQVPNNAGRTLIEIFSGNDGIRIVEPKLELHV